MFCRVFFLSAKILSHELFHEPSMMKVCDWLTILSKYLFDFPDPSHASHPAVSHPAASHPAVSYSDSSA